MRCLFFARYAELLDTESLEIVLPSDATVADAIGRVRASVPGADQLPEQPMVARNQEHVRIDTSLSDGDELAFLPPLAGG